MRSVHTPGPWRSVRCETGEYYTHEINASDGHVASIAGWTTHGTTCSTTEANARLITQAPDMAIALRALIAWAEDMGGWEARCWEAARETLARALGTKASVPLDGDSP